MAELLLELLSEEIPAAMQADAAAALKRLVTEKLKDSRLDFTRAESFHTPRRLALVVEGLPERQPDLVEERKGPRIDAPSQAVQGFLRSVGLASVEECEVRAAGKATFYFARISRAGRPSREVLAGIVGEVAPALPWPKSMRWGGGQLRYVRPLHGVLAVFERRPLDGAIAAPGRPPLRFGATTVGHRFLAPGAFEVQAFADYVEKLRRAFVILDPAERRQAIERQARDLASAQQLTLKDDKGLLAETAGLVEWPVVLMGRIDDAFMALPPEVLATVLRRQQRCFSLLDGAGKPASRFLLVANMVARDGGATIVRGSERVVRARLSDAKFFWDQDRRRPLAERAPALRGIVFHDKLGTLDAKIDRVEALAVAIAEHVVGADKDRVRSAVRLAKADLSTEMVREFPELQGAMGRYYALAEGEKLDVADAIAEHYSPLGPNDRCPRAPVSVVVALADKIDSLVGFFAIGEKPTGSKDPYALRRAALGVIRLILENDLRLSLVPVFQSAFQLYGTWFLQDHDFVQRVRRKYLTTNELTDENIEAKWKQGLREKVTHSQAADVAFILLVFLADRLKVHLRDRGVRHDLIDAVFGQGGQDDLVRMLARVAALGDFLSSEDGADLLTAYRRASNI
ncbi:MAG: glycine--tRNA ligase subunit beta, partial [Alphaproteobacteria bacterium]